jgi:hypothetical protein
LTEGIGFPFFAAGSNLVLRTASIVSSVKPFFNVFIGRIKPVSPSAPNAAANFTVPLVLFYLAILVE